MQHIEKTITDLQGKIQEHERNIAAIQTTINSLCEIIGKPPMYENVSVKNEQQTLSFRSDQFYGQPLMSSLRDIMKHRKVLNRGPASVNELFDSLVNGGFKFETKDDTNSKRGLRISLRKNSKIFHRLPNGLWGLLEWYPNAKQPKNDEPEEDTDDENAQDAETPAKVEMNPK